MITIEVLGIPRPGGGKIAGFNKRSGKSFVRPDNPNTKVWRADVHAAAMMQYKGPLLDCPLEMTYEFRFPRPQTHYHVRKKETILRADAPSWHTGIPDLTKIIRSTEDALIGIVYKDDSRVCFRTELKRYCNEGEKPGVSIVIQERQS